MRAKKCVGQSVEDKKEGSHRVTICHRTCSKTNPWVRITIDKNAWEDTGCGHQMHNVNSTCNRTPSEVASIWGGFNQDYLIKDHKSKDVVAEELNGPNGCNGNTCPDKLYWKYWERACPYAQKGNCCNITAGECCGIPEPAPVPSIILDKTVHLGLLTECNSSLPDSEEVVIEEADVVTFCYEICNNGNTTLCNFILYDNTDDFEWSSGENLCLAPDKCTFAKPNPSAFCLNEKSIAANVTAISQPGNQQVFYADNALVNVTECKKKPKTPGIDFTFRACKRPSPGWPEFNTNGPVRPSNCYAKAIA